MHQNPLEHLLKYRLLSPTLRVSESVGLGRMLRICIFTKFPSDAATAGLGPTLEELLPNHWLMRTVQACVM